jgi:tetratricopeptide (TPR) repeat protein
VISRSWRLAIVLAAFTSAPAWSEGAASVENVAQARELLWNGKLHDAERSFARVLQREDGNVDALVGIAQARRWAGRPLAARHAAARALRLAPDRGDAREELAWAYVDAGRGAVASAVLHDLAAPSAALRARIDELSRPAVTVVGTAYEDSNGAVRLASRVGIALPLHDARLTVIGGGTRVTVAPEALDRGVVGAAVAIPLGRAELTGGWAMHRGADRALLHEGQVGVRLAFTDRARVGLAGRRRPLVEVESLATDEVAYHASGPGGALDPRYVAQRGVDELRLSMQGAPFRAVYAYADARGFTVTDANRGWSLAAGTGLNLLAVLGAGGPVDMVLRWDAYLTGFAEARPGYFSPSFLDGHSPGVELRARAGSVLELVAEGGYTLSLVSDRGPGGWYGGGGVMVRAGALTFSARGQARNDPWYASRRAFVSIGTRL